MYRIMIVEDDEVSRAWFPGAWMRSAYRIFPVFSPNLP